MELFEISVNPRYQNIIDDLGPVSAETVTIELLQPLGFMGGDEDLELFQETLAEVTGEARATVTAAHLQEAVQQHREDYPEVWSGNWAVLVDSHHGVFCPQIAGQLLSQSTTEGVSREELQILQEGPEHANYWETWETVLNNCVISAEGERFGLIQDEDVFLVPLDALG